MLHLTGCVLTSTFRLRWSARLTLWRHMQKQQAKDAAAAAAGAAEAAPTAAAEAASSGPADSGPQKNNLVHAWVMVLAGKREVTCCHTHLTSSAIMHSAHVEVPAMYQTTSLHIDVPATYQASSLHVCVSVLLSVIIAARPAARV